MVKSDKLKQLLCTHRVLSNENNYYECKNCGKVGTEQYFKDVDRSLSHKFARWLIKKLFDDNDSSGGVQFVF